MLWLIAWSFVGLSVWINARNATTIEALILGIGLDVFAAVCAACIVSAWRDRRYGIAVICIGFVILGVGWSLKSAAGTAAHGRFSKERSISRAFQDQKQLEQDIAAAETELGAYDDLRATAEIDGEIHAILNDPRAGGAGDPDKACSVIDGKFTRENCPRLGPLRIEAGKARARDDLVKKRVELRAKKSKLTPVAAREPDVENAVRLAERLGFELHPDTYRLGDNLFFVLAVEFTKTFAVMFVAWLTPRSRPRDVKVEIPVEKPQISPQAAVSEQAATTPAPLALPAPAEPLAWLQELFEQRSRMPAGMDCHNGRLFGSLDAYAEASGLSKSTVERRLTRWASAGLIGQRRTKRGTEVWLIRH